MAQMSASGGIAGAGADVAGLDMTDEWLTTSTILQDLRDFENHTAWHCLVERFREPVVAFARSLGASPPEAEDVAQESLLAFAEAYRGGKFDPSRGRLSKWLFGITYRQVLQQRKQDARRHRLSPGQQVTSFWNRLPKEPEATATWDEEWEKALLAQCVRQVAKEVEEQTMRAFQLVVIHEKSPTEAANMLGVPVKLIYNAKHRVLQRIRVLRKEFEQLDAVT